jgi:hypothetical protein
VAPWFSGPGSTSATEQPLDRLADMYDRLAPPAEVVAAVRADAGDAPEDPVAVREEAARAATERADLLADARVNAYRVLGQGSRGVGIMARRLRGGVGNSDAVPASVQVSARPR